MCPYYTLPPSPAKMGLFTTLPLIQPRAALTSLTPTCPLPHPSLSPFPTCMSLFLTYPHLYLFPSSPVPHLSSPFLISFCPPSLLLLYHLPVSHPSHSPFSTCPSYLPSPIFTCCHLHLFPHSLLIRSSSIPLVSLPPTYPFSLLFLFHLFPIPYVPIPPCPLHLCFHHFCFSAAEIVLYSFFCLFILFWLRTLLFLHFLCFFTHIDRWTHKRDRRIHK